jgi:hypothetical protein
VAAIALAQTLGVVPMIIKGALCVPSDLLRIRKPFVAAGLLLSGFVFFYTKRVQSPCWLPVLHPVSYYAKHRRSYFGWRV